LIFEAIMATTKNFAESIRRKLATDPDLAASVDIERFNANVGAEIFSARKAAGLTQKQLAERVGMHQSAIARLEDADYDGHSLKTLERIAAALGKQIEIRFVEPLAVEYSAVVPDFSVGNPEWTKDWSSVIGTPEITILPIRPNGRKVVA
jgi:transcriptional regulator with XRE-family HTH domain